MTVNQFIDYIIPGENRPIKKLVESSGINLRGEVSKLKLLRAYELAACMKMDGVDCVCEIVKTMDA
jgi:hypothetical protein